MSLVRDVIGRIACWIECLNVEELGLPEWWLDRVGELGSKVDRENGEVFGDSDFSGIESDRLIDRGVLCRSTIDSFGLGGAGSRLRRERKMCNVVWATMLIVQMTKPASTAPCVSVGLLLVLAQVQPKT